MRATRWIALVGLCCFMMACATKSAPLRPATYTVMPHDTLYGIAWRHDLDYRDLARWNNIGPDFRVNVGQVLTLAPPSGSVPIAAAQSAAHAAAHSPSRTQAAPTVPPTATQPKPALDPAALQAHWVWPTTVKSAPLPVPGGGILLLGELGQEIRAAGAGRVVYTGSGLRAYGNLVIIKHSETLLSSYAHNRELLVHEGDTVTAGQPIARMGVGPHQVSALYFEIRINGKPTDPSPYLPAK